MVPRLEWMSPFAAPLGLPWQGLALVSLVLVLVLGLQLVPRLVLVPRLE